MGCRLVGSFLGCPSPDALACREEVARRQGLRRAPHVAPLSDYLDRMRTALGPDRPVPDFDPCDGGAAARLLILLETPGPGVADTMLVSCDHASGTARNLRRFLGAAGVTRNRIVVWNAVPWIIHAGGRNRAPRRGEIAEGAAWLPACLDLLPELRACVLLGRVAQMAAPILETVRPVLPTWRAPHPSPTYVCTAPDIAGRIVAALSAARALL